MPLISPPTPPQLEQDKASIDASFTRAFTLIDTLAAETATLKASEAERTEKLDATLRDVDSVIADLKAANTRRENESRSISDQVQGLKDLVPEALEGWRESGDKRLEELGGELRSLKKLLSNRVGGGNGGQMPAPSSAGRTYNSTLADRPSSMTPGGSSTPPTGGSSTPNGIASSGTAESEEKASSTASIPSAPAPGVNVPRRETPGSAQGSGSGRAAIPAWQMAASKKGEGVGGAEAGA